MSLDSLLQSSVVLTDGFFQVPGTPEACLGARRYEGAVELAEGQDRMKRLVGIPWREDVC